MVCGAVILHVEWSEYESNIHLLHLSVTALPLSYQTFNAPSRARTYYLSVNSRTLCQMSYGSTLLPRFELGLRGSKPRVIYRYTIRAIGTYVVPTYYVIGLIFQHLVEPIRNGKESNPPRFEDKSKFEYDCCAYYWICLCEESNLFACALGLESSPLPVGVHRLCSTHYV